MLLAFSTSLSTGVVWFQDFRSLATKSRSHWHTLLPDKTSRTPARSCSTPTEALRRNARQRRSRFFIVAVVIVAVVIVTVVHSNSKGPYIVLSSAVYIFKKLFGKELSSLKFFASYFFLMFSFSFQHGNKI